jgi:hypothetical protein
LSMHSKPAEAGEGGDPDIDDDKKLDKDFLGEAILRNFLTS